MAQLSPLFAETVGESMAGDDLGRSEELGLVAGDAGAEQQIRRRQQQRAAAFGGGGGAAQGGQGATGLGSAGSR